MSTSLLSQVTFLSEPDLCYQHDKFPSGRKIGTSSSNRGEKINLSKYGLQEAETYRQQKMMNGNDSSKLAEGSPYLRLPRLTLDKPLPQRKGASCSYVNNHKTYLKMKGFDLNHVYSLKRNRVHVDAYDSKSSSAVHTTLTTLSNSDMTITGPLKGTQSMEEKVSSKKESERVWRPDESREPKYGHAPNYTMKGIDTDTKVYDQRRVGYLTSKRLGKVMTRTHLRSLLALEEPSVPNTYYMKFTNSVDKLK